MKPGTAPLADSLRSRSGVAVSAKKVSLTEYESLLLAIVVRDEPTTAYKICKVVERSPTAGFSSSAGAVYPIVGRLKARGLVRAAAVEADGRNTELLVATREGRAAVRKWIVQVTPDQLLPVDPLRTRIGHAGMLSPAERLAWLAKMRDALAAKLEEIEAYAAAHREGLIDYAHRHAIHITEARLAWLDEILAIETDARS
jgi:DNA-binding PadR family transcriptional regulator